jgi:hypothetical protein
MKTDSGDRTCSPLKDRAWLSSPTRQHTSGAGMSRNYEIPLFPLQKPPVPQLLKNFPTRRFTTILKIARHWPLSKPDRTSPYRHNLSL